MKQSTLWLSLFALILAAAPTLGADDRAAQIQQELARERQLLEEERAAHASELDQLRQRRAGVAARLIGLEVARQSAQRSELEAAAEAQRLEEDLQAVESAVSTLSRQASSAGASAQLTLGELPGGEAVFADFARFLEETGDFASPEAVARLARGLDALHAQSAQLSVSEATIWTATGESEPVRLLSIGHVGAGYLADDGRVGLAVAAPAEASGYRWTEEIGPRAAAAVRSAIEQVAAGQAGATVPVDVTGRLSAAALAPSDGWRSRLEAGGLLMAPLGLVALAALLLIIERAFVLYGRNRYGNRAALWVLRAVEKGELDDAARVDQRYTGAVARTLAACLARRSHGQHAMEDAVQEQLLHEMPRLQRFLGGVAVLAAVAPLLGLLGTVTGIIQTFAVIQSFGNASPNLMAGGISEALTTTAAGLVIAIPVLLLHSILRGRVQRIIADAEKHAATLLNRLSHGR